MDKTAIYKRVQEHYGLAAKSTDTAYSQTVAKAFGYSAEELAMAPGEANLGLSCGNPVAIANLREGETVVDLGSGAGFDVFLAARKVGAQGKAIGIDMNKDMLERANQNKAKAKADNASFIESNITKIALPDATADCIISNCVVNLVPEGEKQLVFNEMFRLLKPGGRLAISDLLVKKDLSEELKANMALYVGCVAGASRMHDYETYLRRAGFSDPDGWVAIYADHNMDGIDTLIADSHVDLNVYLQAKEGSSGGSCCGESSEGACCEKSPSCCNKRDMDPGDVLELSKLDLNELAGSFKVYAIKA